MIDFFKKKDFLRGRTPSKVPFSTYFLSIIFTFSMK